MVGFPFLPIQTSVGDEAGARLLNQVRGYKLAWPIHLPKAIMGSVKKTTYIVLLFLSGVLSIGVAHRVAPTREPVYQGKPLSAWLEDLNSTSLYTQDSAKAAIREMGINAVPALVQVLRARDSRLKSVLMDLAGKQSVVRCRFRTAEERHLMAIKGCRASGPLARPAIPALIGFLNHAETANEAAYSLVVVDQEIFPLTRAVTNEHYEVSIRCAAAARLASGQYDETTVVAVLLRTLQDKKPEISSQAARALGVINRDPGLVIPALTECLSNPSALVRRESAGALGCFGPKAQSALPLLLKASEDGDRAVRKEAVAALKKIHQTADASSQ